MNIKSLYLIVVTALFLIHVQCAEAMPAPTGIAGIISGDGYSNATVIVVATEPGTNVRIDSFITATDKYGRFAGVVSTDFDVEMDLHVSVISGSMQKDILIGNISAGDDQLLEILLNESGNTEEDNSNPTDDSRDTAEKGRGAGGFGFTAEYKVPDKRQLIPPIDKEWAARIAEEDENKKKLTKGELSELRQISGQSPVLQPKIQEGTVIYLVSLLMTIVIILIVLVLELHKSIRENKRGRGSKRGKRQRN